MKQNLKKSLSILLAVLFVFFALSCAKEEKKEEPIEPTITSTQEENGKIEKTGLWKDAVYLEDKTFGDGKKTVEVEVKAEEKSVTFTLKTDKENLGDALLEHKIVEGDQGPFGLYIKRVNGMLADYDIDQSYWSFCKDGKAQDKGVSDTKISGGEHFELVYTK